MVGRDIGTVVLPRADLKIYLTASPQERARRRLKDFQTKGQGRDYGDVLSATETRDRLDSERPLAPLRPASDAIIIDTENRSIEGVVAAIEEAMGKN